MTVLAGRCVCPATTRSTVVLWMLFTIPTIGPSHAAAGWAATRLAPRTAPSWMTTTWTLTPRLRSFADSRRMRSASSRNTRPAVASARTSSGVIRTVEPITPTRTPLTLKTADVSIHGGSRPVDSSTMFVDRNGKSARARCWRMRGTP